ncbi:hypothetical protein OTK49_00230 [Vibrio coralliirubri]|uniref:hypothetical protein n=1 Tax=Vibrio coralliirubri TaxID=1516159 RepID=UPI002283D871|nr:hypothetical protein [Vibrio coralliirubri]MCY9860967.1 hypothetical protein [Vibrio coralliirubri]
MTNNNQAFTPSFTTKQGDNNQAFKEIVVPKSESEISSTFTEGAGIATVMPTNNESVSMPDFDSLASDIDSLLMDDEEIDLKKPSLSDLGYSDNEFDKILSEVDSMSSGGGSISSSASVLSMLDEGEEDYDDGDQVEISEELREEIFAEGYMAGSLSQKEVMDKRLQELQATVQALKITAATPASLSNDVNAAISVFIREVARSVLSESKQNLLAEIVESRVEEFVTDVKAWELQTNVYCSEPEFNNLKEIFGEDDLSNFPITETDEPIGFIRKNVHYILERELPSGRFRLEIEREHSSKIEAVMELDSHLAAIEDLLGEAI